MGLASSSSAFMPSTVSERGGSTRCDTHDDMRSQMSPVDAHAGVERAELCDGVVVDVGDEP